MKKLFLTSSISEVAHDIVKKVDLSKGNKLVFITTAADAKTGDKTWLKKDRQTLIDSGFAVTDYTIANKTINQLKNDLHDFKYIYLSGGNTVYLLQQSQKSGFTDLIKDLINNKGKTYIGTSAGSIIAGPFVPKYIMDENKDIQVDNSNGYSFVNFTILPHWGSEHFKEKYFDKRLKTAYIADQVPLVLISDTQYVCVQDDMFEIIDVKK